MKMKPSQLIEFLRFAIPARMAVLIVGPPGVGKTDIVKQVCKELAYQLIVSFPAVEDPTEPGGYPWIAEDRSHAVKVLFGQAHRAVSAVENSVWFLDDLGQAPPATQAGYMQWLLAGAMNGHQLPECVSMIAASNRRTDRAGVSGILEPVKSRFITIVELVPDLDEFSQWAFTQPYFDAEDVAFLRFRPELLCQFTPTADLVNCPLPRTWAHAAKLLRLGLPPAVEAAALAGAVGEGAAGERLAFRQLVRQLPNIDAILIDPDGAPIPDQPAALYATATALATRANDQTFGRVARYAERLLGAAHGEFATLLLRDAVRRQPTLTETPEFVKLASGPLGALIGGAS